MEMPRGRLAAVFASFALLFAASSAQAQVVISQVYGGGGNSGATLKNDFIELRNNGPTAVDLTGWSVQYTSSAGTSWGSRTNLSGSIPAGGFYLVQQAQGAGGTVDLPTPDAVGTIAMSGTAGKVALSRSTTALTGAGSSRSVPRRRRENSARSSDTDASGSPSSQETRFRSSSVIGEDASMGQAVDVGAPHSIAFDARLGHFPGETARSPTRFADRSRASRTA